MILKSVPKTINVMLMMLVLALYCLPLNAQQDVLDDGKLKVTTTVEKLEDAHNNRFYDFYRATIENTTNQPVSFTLQFVFSVNGEKRRSDVSPVIKLAPGESISGDRTDARYLTLFKAYNIGNSGKKLSDKTYQLKTVTINYQ